MSNELAVSGQAKAALQAAAAPKVPATMAGLKSSSVANVFALYKDQIARAIPKHLTAERVIQLATTMISRTPDLAQCTSESLIGAVMQVSILGFEPVPALGLAYFVPRNNSKTGRKEVTLIIGYRGLIDLSRRSDEIKTIYAQAVYANDYFEYEFGLDPKLVHRPVNGERGPLTHAYAVAKFNNGGFAFDVMTKKDIEDVRKRSKASDNGPWTSDYAEMCKKTTVRRLSKILPLSVDSMRAMAVDNAVVNIDRDPARSAFLDGGEIDLNKVEYTESTDAEDARTAAEPTTEEAEPEKKPAARKTEEQEPPPSDAPAPTLL